MSKKQSNVEQIKKHIETKQEQKEKHYKISHTLAQAIAQYILKTTGTGNDILYMIDGLRNLEEIK